jgi:hypothetical protein
MKIKNRTRKAQTCLWTVALITIAAGMAAQAATALNGRVIARPLTPGDVALYGLPASTEYSGGLNTLAIGTPAYLEADVNIAIAPASITNITWTLTAPGGSAAALSASPLPATVPIYEPSDKLVYQVAGRQLLRPDLAGEYTVTATIATTTSGTTQVTAVFNVGTYMGVYTCELCHSGGVIAQDIYPSWATTAHASIFTEGIDGLLGSGYSQSCIKCHTVGYDTNASALNVGGFYGVAQADGWTFPTVLPNSNFASMPTNLQNLADIQCENCHGPGSQHAGALGQTSVSNWPLLAVSYTSGDCNQCHDDPPHHAYGTQWYASSHAVTTTTPSGPGRDQCVQCHTAYGFITAVSNSVSTNTTFAPTNTTFAAIGCQTCHEPHGLTIPTGDNHLLRVMASAKFGDGTVITNGGEGNLCMNCHHSRNGSAVANVANWPKGIPTWPGAAEPPSSRDFGPHENPQGDMIEGINAITYGQVIPSSAHRDSVTNSCVGCHMQTVASSDPGFLLSGGHTWEMSYNVVTNGVTNKVDRVAVCNQCHGGITTFNFPVQDYANVGTILGVQTEVQILLNQLSTLLPNSKGVVDGSVKSSLSVTTNWTTAQLNAAYNFQFVSADGSLGVHNAPFATGLLKASIANLTGTSVPGGLPDAWEISYFGSITNALGAPDADPAGDGIPNWLKYSLGLNPLVPGLAVPDGVVYVNNGSLGGSTNSIQIYTAAEITFNTVAGSTYQIQEVSSLSQGWQNVGTPISATNTGSMSYLTPTQGTTQQFFRVVSQ